MCRGSGQYGNHPLQPEGASEHIFEDWQDVASEEEGVPPDIAPSYISQDISTNLSDEDYITPQLQNDRQSATDEESDIMELLKVPNKPRFQQVRETIASPIMEPRSQSPGLECIKCEPDSLELVQNNGAACIFDTISMYEDQPCDQSSPIDEIVQPLQDEHKVQKRQADDLAFQAESRTGDEALISGMHQTFRNLTLKDEDWVSLRSRPHAAHDRVKKADQSRSFKFRRARTFPSEKPRDNKRPSTPLSRVNSTSKCGFGKALTKGVTRMFEDAFLSGCKILHFFGSAGSGKTQYLNSFILKSQDSLVQDDAGQSPNRPIIASISLKDRNETEPADILLEIAVQIEEQSSSVIAEIANQEYSALDKPVSLLEIRNLWRRVILHLCTRYDVLVVIDGVVDTTAYQEPALREIVQLCIESSRMRCVIASRSRLGLCTSTEISSGIISEIDLNNDPEIRTLMENRIDYELHKVCQRQQVPRAPTKEIAKYSKAIVEKSNGIYVCAELFLRHAIQKISSDGLFDPNSVPNVKAPGPAYTFMLDQVPQHSLALTKEMCSWALCSKKEFTPSQFADILMLKDNPNAEPIKNSDEDTIKFCESKMEWVSAHLIKIERGNQAEFIYATVKDYLLNSNSRFSIPATDAHETIALTEINYLANANLEKDLSSDCEQRKKVCEYMVTSLPEHCHLAEGKATCLPAMLLHFMENKFTAFKAWAAAYDKLQPQSGHRKIIPKFVDGETILMCATFGFATLTNLLLERGRDPNGMHFGNNPMPCDVAVLNGYPLIASMLVRYGANYSHMHC